MIFNFSPRTMFYIKRTSIGIGTFLVLLIIYFFYWFFTPFVKDDAVNTEYYIHSGTPLSKVAFHLYENYGLKHPHLFIAYVRYIQHDTHVKPGTYLATAEDSPHSFIRKILTGDTYKIRVTIPEGFNMYQVADRLSILFHDTTKKMWMGTICSEPIVKKTKLSRRVPCAEGFLYPETYFLDPNENPAAVIETMIDMFYKHVTLDLIQKAEAKKLDLFQWITFASMIEKETNYRPEKPEISAVFWNRLKKNIKLQSDPTVIYGMWNMYKGNLRKNDLLRPTPYNTYTKYGLPIGPIASPALDSLMAVLNPAKSKIMYFVADGHGRHVFSETYAHHRTAVRRLIEVERGHRYPHNRKPIKREKPTPHTSKRK